MDLRMRDLHEIKELKERVCLLEEAIRELLIYVSPFPKSPKEAGDLCKGGGYTSELVPRFTQIGNVKVADRVAEICKLVTPISDKKDDEA